jgi:integrase
MDSRPPGVSLDGPRSTNANPDIRFLTLEEVEALLRAVPDDDLGRVERVLYLAAAMSGLRLGELLALRWLDVDWQVSLIRVRQSYSRSATCATRADVAVAGWSPVAHVSRRPATRARRACDSHPPPLDTRLARESGPLSRLADRRARHSR